MTAQPCPDCGHDIDEKHGAPGCSERVQNGNNTEFCQCKHDAQTARRLAAGERLARLVLLLAGAAAGYGTVTAEEQREMEAAVDYILCHKELDK